MSVKEEDRQMDGRTDILIDSAMLNYITLSISSM